MAFGIAPERILGPLFHPENLMKHHYSLQALVQATLVGAILCAFVHFSYAQTEFDASGFDKMRVENEAKLSVPDAITEKVWEYMEQNFHKDLSKLLAIDSAFSSTTAEDIFVDQYYDNDDFQLLEGQSGVRHRTRTVLTDEENRKNGRELLQIKLNDINQNELSRGEVKYPIEHLDKKSEKWDYHPLLGIVEKAYRQDVVDQLATVKIDAESLYPTVKITQNRRRVYVLHKGLPYSTLTLDMVEGEYEGKKTKFTELELELNEINYTESDSSTRVMMEKTNALFKDDIMAAFPEIKQDQTPKYNKAINGLGLKREDLVAAKKSERTMRMALYAGIGLLAAGGLFWIVRSRTKGKKQKKTVVING
jgi:hypothetical protein